MSMTLQQDHPGVNPDVGHEEAAVVSEEEVVEDHQNLVKVDPAEIHLEAIHQDEVEEGPAEEDVVQTSAFNVRTLTLSADSIRATETISLIRFLSITIMPGVIRTTYIKYFVA